MSKQVLKRVSPHTSVWVDKENKKQSSIEWLVEQMIKYELVPKGIHFDNVLFHQAKVMHKEGIEDAWLDGVGNWDSEKEAQQYYKETFGG